MLRNTDTLKEKILKFIENSDEPMETKEIELFVKQTRIKVLYRLNNLRGERMINGKPVGSGKGAWVWWREDAFERSPKKKK